MRLSEGDFSTDVGTVAEQLTVNMLDSLEIQQQGSNGARGRVENTSMAVIGR